MTDDTEVRPSCPSKRSPIRRAETIADYRACQEAQRRAWGIAEDGYLIPIATMVGANLHGGLVLGAFRPDGEAVAMSFAFLGRIEGRLCLYSQLTGVVPGYQSQGLGYRIKMHQREVARAEGIEPIAWAFDPLQAGNAHFNLVRLGASAGRYVENMYGERTDALNAGVPTDRLIAEWDVEAEPTRRVRPDAAAVLPRLFRTTADQRGACPRDRHAGGGCLVGIPGMAELPDRGPRRHRTDCVASIPTWRNAGYWRCAAGSWRRSTPATARSRSYATRPSRRAASST